MFRKRESLGCEDFRQSAGPHFAVSGVESAKQAGRCSLSNHGCSAATCSGGLAILLLGHMGPKGGVRFFFLFFLNHLFSPDEYILPCISAIFSINFDFLSVRSVMVSAS